MLFENVETRNHGLGTYLITDRTILLESHCLSYTRHVKHFDKILENVEFFLKNLKILKHFENLEQFENLENKLRKLEKYLENVNKI